MTQCILALSSLTYAMKGHLALQDRAIWSKIIKIDSGMTKRGCAYGIQIDCIHLNNVQNIFINNNIPYSEILGG